jgi:hypothetical protein
MSNRVLLNNVDHHDVRVITRYSATYGDAINQALIFPTEFEEAQRDYPILFRTDAEGKFVAVVLLGLDADENLFLEDGRWDARHVPAIQQRGPFSIGVPRPDADENAEPMIHIDLDDPRVSRTEGEAVFRTHGGNAPYLDHIAAVLRAIHVGHEVMTPMFAAFEELDLVQPVTIQLPIDDGLRYDLPDFFTIAPERLAALDGTALATLHQNGFLRAAFAAAFSLSNINRLVERKQAKRRREDAAVA